MKNKKYEKIFVGILGNAYSVIYNSISNTVLCGRCSASARRATVIRRGKNELDADEVVKAKDLELETGSIFEVEKDFTGLEIPDEKKVKITFHEAKMRKSRTLQQITKIHTKLFIM